MLTVDAVSYSYPNTPSPALRELSLQVQVGEVFGLLGPNGAGKSTLMALLSGLRQPDTGQVVRASARFALVPQELAFYPMLSARENLEFFAAVQGLRGKHLKTRVRAALDFAQLAHVAGQRASTFSGGLKRRLNLAIGIVAEPELLLLDEPTVGVDPQSRAFLLQAIAELGRQGCTIVYTSHYMEEVQQLCPRIAIIDLGRVLVQGTIAELLQDDGDELTLSSTPALNAHDLPAGFALKLQSGERTVITRMGAQPWSQLLAALENADLHLHQWHYGQRDLETLFLSLTKRQLRD